MGARIARAGSDLNGAKLLERLGLTVDASTGLNGTSGSGLAPGTVQPLRDSFVPVGELNAETGAAAGELHFTARERPMDLARVARRSSREAKL